MNIDVGKMLGFLSTLRIAHWNADTVTNEHKAIGELYSALDDLVDDYAEICLGKHGGKVTASSFEKAPMDNGAMIQVGTDCVSEARSELKAGRDDDLLNILADMDTALNKARYLLKTATPKASKMDGVMGSLRSMAK